MGINYKYDGHMHVTVSGLVPYVHKVVILNLEHNLAKTGMK